MFYKLLSLTVVPAVGLLLLRVTAQLSTLRSLPLPLAILAAAAAGVLFLGTPGLVSRWASSSERSGMLLSLVLYQGGTLLGALLTLWTYDFNYFLPFAVASFLSMSAVPVVRSSTAS